MASSMIASHSSSVRKSARFERTGGVSQTHTQTHTHRHTHTDTHTQTHTQTHTDTHRHTHTKAVYFVWTNFRALEAYSTEVWERVLGRCILTLNQDESRGAAQDLDCNILTRHGHLKLLTDGVHGIKVALPSDEHKKLWTLRGRVAH